MRPKLLNDGQAIGLFGLSTPFERAAGKALGVPRSHASIIKRRRQHPLLYHDAAGAAIIGMPSAAGAQVLTDISRAPTLTIVRYHEDWSNLADPAERKGRWTERFKYIQLNGDGSIYLSTGVEARSRYESYENVNWGSAPDDGYVGHRLMP